MSTLARRLARLALAVGAAGIHASAHADGARDWENVPVDTNLLFAYYNYSRNEIAFDPSLPVEGARIESQLGIMRYARTFALGDRMRAFRSSSPMEGWRVVSMERHCARPRLVWAMPPAYFW